MKGYPKWFNPRFISGFVLALFVSGSLLVPTALEMRLALEMPWRLPNSLRIFTAALHSGLAFLMFGILGMLYTIHMRHGWKQKRNVRSGFAQLAIWGILGLTGLGLYYLPSEKLLSATSLAHAGAGLVVVVFYIWHSYFFATKKKAR